MHDADDLTDDTEGILWIREGYASRENQLLNAVTFARAQSVNNFLGRMNITLGSFLLEEVDAGASSAKATTGQVCPQG